MATPADLGEQAGHLALEEAGTEPGDVDLVVLGTSTLDKLMPATVNEIADRRGIDGGSPFQRMTAKMVVGLGLPGR